MEKIKTKWDGLPKAEKAQVLKDSGYDNKYLIKKYSGKSWDELTEATKYLLSDADKKLSYNKVYDSIRTKDKDIEDEMAEPKENRIEGEGDIEGFGNEYLNLIFAV